MRPTVETPAARRIGRRNEPPTPTKGGFAASATRRRLGPEAVEDDLDVLLPGVRALGVRRCLDGRADEGADVTGVELATDRPRAAGAADQLVDDLVQFLLCRGDLRSEE